MPYSIENRDDEIHPRAEIDAAFARYVRAIESRQWGEAGALFTDDARGRQAEIGPFPPGREGIRSFMARCPEHWDLRCVWSTVQDNYVLYKWCHVLRGSGDGHRFYGYCELHYAGRGRFDWLMSYPDMYSMRATKREWQAAAAPRLESTYPAPQ